MKIDNRAPADTENELVVFTEGNHTWILSEPDEDGLRTVYRNCQEEGKGILLGSVRPIGLGYMTQSPDIELGKRLGIKFPDRSAHRCVLMSTPVTAVIIMTKEEVAAVSS